MDVGADKAGGVCGKGELLPDAGMEVALGDGAGVGVTGCVLGKEAEGQKAEEGDLRFHKQMTASNTPFLCAWAQCRHTDFGNCWVFFVPTAGEGGEGAGDNWGLGFAILDEGRWPFSHLRGRTGRC